MAASGADGSGLPEEEEKQEFKWMASKQRFYGSFADLYANRQFTPNEPASQVLGSTPGLKRKRMNYLAILVNFWAPWLLFLGIYSMMTFRARYLHPVLAPVTVGVGLFIAVATLFLAFVTKKNHKPPAWYGATALAFFIAVAAAAGFGELNYKYNMMPYFTLMNMETYTGINPASEPARKILDVGRVYFTKGTFIDVRKAIGFKDTTQYCVVPITNGRQQLPSYDYWAVGTDCCSGTGPDFACGEYDNPHSRAGLRLVNDDQRPFFRLAVQQAEAMYNIKSEHPMFFQWMQDPVQQMVFYRDDGFFYFMIGLICHFLFNAAWVACFSWSFWKVDQNWDKESIWD